MILNTLQARPHFKTTEELEGALYIKWSLTFFSCSIMLLFILTHQDSALGLCNLLLDQAGQDGLCSPLEIQAYHIYA